MKNLYIYVLRMGNGNTSLKKEVWQDVSKTRDGKIVKKRDKKYNLDHGHYKEVNELNQYIGRKGYADKFVQDVTYFSFEDDVDKSLLVKPFIEDREREIELLNEEIKKFKELIQGEDA